MFFPEFREDNEGSSVNSFKDELKEALEKQDIKDWRK